MKRLRKVFALVTILTLLISMSTGVNAEASRKLTLTLGAGGAATVEYTMPDGTIVTDYRVENSSDTSPKVEEIRFKRNTKIVVTFDEDTYYDSTGHSYDLDYRSISESGMHIGDGTTYGTNQVYDNNAGGNKAAGANYIKTSRELSLTLGSGGAATVKYTDPATGLVVPAYGVENPSDSSSLNEIITFVKGTELVVTFAEDTYYPLSGYGYALDGKSIIESGMNSGPANVLYDNVANSDKSAGAKYVKTASTLWLSLGEGSVATVLGTAADGSAIDNTLYNNFDSVALMVAIRLQYDSEITVTMDELTSMGRKFYELSNLEVTETPHRVTNNVFYDDGFGKSRTLTSEYMMVGKSLLVSIDNGGKATVTYVDPFGNPQTEMLMTSGSDIVQEAFWLMYDTELDIQFDVIDEIAFNFDEIVTDPDNFPGDIDNSAMNYNDDHYKNERDVIGRFSDEIRYMIRFDIHPDTPFGSVEPDTDELYYRGTTVTGIPDPDEGYEFLGWYGYFWLESTGLDESRTVAFVGDEKPTQEFKVPMDLLLLSDLPSNIYEVDGYLNAAEEPRTRGFAPEGRETMVIYAKFGEIPPDPDPVPTDPTPTTYTLTVNVVGEGSVPGYEGSGSFSSGTNVNLSAVLDSGSNQVFEGWSGDASGSSEDLLVILTSDKTVTATFADIPEEDVPLSFPELDELIVEEEPIPEAVLTEEIQDDSLPETGGIPMSAMTLFGLAISGIGMKLRRRR